MKKFIVLFVFLSAVAVLSNSCGKGCTCHVKGDVYNISPVFEDGTMGKEDCQLKEAALNAQYGRTEDDPLIICR